MTTVSVIGSVHNDHGLAIAASLLAILERLQPEIVFLEAPQARFDAYCSDAQSTLEARAVCRYRQVHLVTLVPVDLPAPPLSLRAYFDALFEAIEERSPEYLQLLHAHDHYTTMFGFDYLNSPDCTKLHSDIQAKELAAVQALGSDEITKRYRLWRDAHERREEAMMNNIEAYCRSNAFERGIFLVGSAQIGRAHV